MFKETLNFINKYIKYISSAGNKQVKNTTTRYYNVNEDIDNGTLNAGCPKYRAAGKNNRKATNGRKIQAINMGNGKFKFIKHVA